MCPAMLLPRCCQSPPALTDRYPLNSLSLLGFTEMMAIAVGTICSTYTARGHEELILQMLGLTVAIFLSLTLFTMQSNVDFSFMGMGLFVPLLLLPIAGLLSFLLQSSILHTVCAYGGCLVFSLYILYDTHLITTRLGYDDYVPAVIELYLDPIYYFFQYIICCGGGSSGYILAGKRGGK